MDASRRWGACGSPFLRQKDEGRRMKWKSEDG